MAPSVLLVRTDGVNDRIGSRWRGPGALPTSVLVTGATGGLGQAICRHFAGLGVEVVLAGRDGERLAGLRAEGVGSSTVEADLSTDEGATTLIAAADAVDALVLNAGVASLGALHRRTPESIGEELMVNLVVPARVASSVIDRWRPRGFGSMVFVSSLAAKNWRPGMATYSASKAGLRALVWALRQEHSASQLHVGLVTPGPIRDAGMFASTASGAPRWWPTRSPDDVARGVERSLRHRVGEVTVAPGVLRAWAALAAASPRANARVNGLLGADELLDRFTQRSDAGDCP